MYTVLISGAASGLGKAFLHRFASQGDIRIIAIDRSAILHEFGDPVQSFKVDVSSPASIAAFADQISNAKINLFIHSAGIRGLVPSIASANPSNVAAAETRQVMDLNTMMHTFQVNAAGTFLLLQAVVPKLANGSGGDPAKVVIMGSRMGSVSYNSTGGAYAYRASKAALHAIVKSFSIDVPEVLFTILHPGRVETGLVASREEGAIEAEDSVDDMMKFIGKLGLADSGKFYDRFGESIGW